jgi:hypothetical protein
VFLEQQNRMTPRAALADPPHVVLVAHRRASIQARVRGASPALLFCAQLPAENGPADGVYQPRVSHPFALHA